MWKNGVRFLRLQLQSYNCYLRVFLVLFSENCYNKVMEETRSMQEEIVKELKLDPIDKEVVVLYEGEKEEQSSDFWKVSLSQSTSIFIIQQSIFDYIIYFGIDCRIPILSV